MPTTIVVWKENKIASRIPGRVQGKRFFAATGKKTETQLVNKAVCERLGLDPIKVAKGEIAAPDEAFLKLGANEGGTELLSESQAMERQTPEWKAARADDRYTALDAIVMGLGIIRKAADAINDMQDAWDHAFQRMMDTGSSVMPNLPQPTDAMRQALSDAHAKYPRASAYGSAEHQASSTHWADNTGAGAAGRKAMEIIASGGSLEDAQAALTERREWTD